jgi:hypothetical protein
METSFNLFLEKYLRIWQNSSLSEMEQVISENYQAREITDGKIIDFGFEESIRGWKQGFDFVLSHHGEWKLNLHTIIPLRDNEILAIISAQLIIKKQPMETASLFLQTFTHEFGWKLTRSYIETGIPIEKLAEIR